MYNGENKDRFAEDIERMIKWDLVGRGITDANILTAMKKIRREEFIPEEYLSQAYADGPLPIGLGQTISQPYIVALMTQELKVNSNCKVLEIGTGSGYQTAILCKLAKKVYTIERFEQLTESAKEILGRLGIENVEFCVGDGSCGWLVQKCFDRIMVTAAVPKIPAALMEQLDEGGLIIAPVGSSGVQELVVCKKEKGKITKRTICDVRFVRLIGEHGFEQ